MPQHGRTDESRSSGNNNHWVKNTAFGAVLHGKGCATNGFVTKKLPG
jgi:hypothetical protein